MSCVRERRVSGMFDQGISGPRVQYCDALAKIGFKRRRVREGKDVAGKMPADDVLKCREMMMSRR